MHGGCSGKRFFSLVCHGWVLAQPCTSIGAALLRGTQQWHTHTQQPLRILKGDPHVAEPPHVLVLHRRPVRVDEVHRADVEELVVSADPSVALGRGRRADVRRTVDDRGLPDVGSVPFGRIELAVDGDRPSALGCHAPGQVLLTLCPR